MPDWKVWLAVSVLCAWSVGAKAEESEAAKLIAECSADDLSQASLDSCLERVRVLEETDASAQLQSLEGRLEKRELGGTMSARVEPTSASRADVSRPVREATPPPPENDGYDAQSQESPRSLSGAQADDQPPIADPPDPTSSEDRSRAPDDPEPQF